jgi:hypothetical protein
MLAAITYTIAPQENDVTYVSPILLIYFVQGGMLMLWIMQEFLVSNSWNSLFARNPVVNRWHNVPIRWTYLMCVPGAGSGAGDVAS